ncbi:uncharacterized protein H6S33_003837 [Morchella sextelata]|jgi:hypothetical protein|uniref:uncharacterized protein n=1 Tax=Morchella sextelata TaxID=1174677 RepID=UPI001D03B6C3|nr:uncharacterized protein H6S33_003837 [Morchella sextelata]KAH0606176.1 hypothetical protein H6S33_003837 [Morchella sextelata]
MADLGPSNPRLKDLHLGVMASKRIDIFKRLIPTTTEFPTHKDFKPTIDMAPRPCPGLGRLDRLPMDLHVQIFKRLSVHTICAMRQVNSYAKSVVEIIPAFNSTRKYAPHAFQAILLTGACTLFTIQDLFNVLVTPGCHLCGAFSAQLYLPSLSRCCTNCLELSPSLETMKIFIAQDLFGLTGKQIKEMTGVVNGIAGWYHDYTMYSSVKSTPTLVSRAMVEAAAIRFHGGRLEMERFVENRIKNVKSRRFHTKPQEEWHTRKRATVQFPLLDIKSGETADGIYCRGCQLKHKLPGYRNYAACVFNEPDKAWRIRDVAYDDAGFNAHIRLCQDARDLWKQSEGSREWWLNLKDEGIKWWEERGSERKDRKASRVGKHRMDYPQETPEAFRHRTVAYLRHHSCMVSPASFR